MLQNNGPTGGLSVHETDLRIGITRDRQLAGVDIGVALFKWTHEMACNLKQVAIATGYHYAQVRRWGLPLFDGKITRSEFIRWKRKKWQKRIQAKLIIKPTAICAVPAGLPLQHVSGEWPLEFECYLFGNGRISLPRMLTHPLQTVNRKPLPSYEVFLALHRKSVILFLTLCRV